MEATTTPLEPEPEREDSYEQSVTPLELFFDLVFVFAFTQVTGLMADNPTWEGLGQGMLVLAAVWWAWGGFAWLTNSLHSDDGIARVGLLAAMGRCWSRRWPCPAPSARTRWSSGSPTSSSG